MTGKRRLRVTLLTLGSRGDVEPYVGLGVALVRAGHQTTLAAPAAFEPLIRRAGLNPFRVEPDPRLRSASGEAPQWLSPSAAEGALALRRASRRRRGLARAYSGYLEASRAADVILYPPWLAPVAHSIAEVCGCRPMAAYLTPIHPTRTFPSPLFYVPSLHRWNRLSHRIALWLGRAALNGAPNTWRSQVVGLTPGPIRLLPPKGLPCLYGFSRGLLPRPADWPPEVVVTGPWWLDEQEHSPVLEELERFLNAPGKVVFLGFGSMMDGKAARLNAVVEAALARIGCRAVLLAGPGGLLDLPPSPRRLVVRDVPLAWLFRRVDAIVHHGGAGTSAQAARAGKPSFAVPFFADQHFWGQRIHQAGGGPRPVPRRALTASRLASAIDESLNDPKHAERASGLGALVRREAGLSTAVSLIEAHGWG